MRVTVNSLDCEPYTFIGDMSNELQVTSTGDSITLYSRDITLENGFTSTGQYFEIDHPNSDHPFEDTKDETHIFRRMLPNMVEDWDNEINFSSIKLVITPNSGGNGGKLRIVLNTIVEYHVDSYSYHWDKTDADDYQDRFPAGFEAELTDTQIDAFKECFPVE